MPEKYWERFGGIEAYKSIALSALPNFFIIFGKHYSTILKKKHF